MILLLRSSDARRSLSLEGRGTSDEIKTREKAPASARSTFPRRAAALAVILNAGSGSAKRESRRKLPPEMITLAVAEVGGVEFGELIFDDDLS